MDPVSNDQTNIQADDSIQSASQTVTPTEPASDVPEPVVSPDPITQDPVTAPDPTTTTPASDALNQVPEDQPAADLADPTATSGTDQVPPTSGSF